MFFLHYGSSFCTFKILMGERGEIGKEKGLELVHNSFIQLILLIFPFSNVTKIVSMKRSDA